MPHNPNCERRLSTLHLLGPFDISRVTYPQLVGVAIVMARIKCHNTHGVVGLGTFWGWLLATGTFTTMLFEVGGLAFFDYILEDASGDESIC